MAAFEAISRIHVPTLSSRLSLIDIRDIRLPAIRPPNDDGFDPRDHRQPTRIIPPWMAYFNLLRAGLGAGMLGMPLALSQAGIILGPFLILGLGILIIHTHLTLLWCLNEISRELKVQSISYRYGFRLALLHGPPVFHKLGHCGPVLIATLMILSQMGICTVFVIFTTDSLRDLADWPNTDYALLSLMVPYLILQFLTKSLRAVSYVSLAGNLMNVVGLLLVFVLIFKDPHGEVVHMTTDTIPVMLATGTILFNISAVGVILTLDKALVKPHVMTKKYSGVITIGIFVPTMVAVVFGTLGYWSFGTMDENILRSLPFDNDLSMVAIGLYLVAVAFAYPIQCFPAIHIILEIIKHHDPSHVPQQRCLQIVEYFVRPIFVGLTFMICYFLPVQGPFVGFVGNLSTTLLSLVFPALMELCLLYPNDFGKNYIYLIKDIFIIIFGLFCFIFGVILCVYLIYIRVLYKRNSTNEFHFFI